MESKFLSLSKTLRAQLIYPLDTTEQEQLDHLIQQLCLNLDMGDSCSKITNNNIELLNKSGLAQLMPNANLAMQPLTIYQTEQYNYLYLTRYFYYEQFISQQLNHLCNNSGSIQTPIFNSVLAELSSKSQQYDFPNLDQLNSIKESLTRKFSIITGGPGTGKTTSVVLILWSLFQIYGQQLKVLIGAPTGKATKRVKESLQQNIQGIEKQLGLEVAHINSLLNQAESFGTIHKLLGYIYHSIYFKRNITNPLDCEVLIIDESSMISLPLFYKLISALDVTKIKHLIFLGDPNQLSSVEEGFVFSSLVNAKNSNRYVSKLTISKRNIGEVGQLANAILIDDKQQIETLLTTGINLSLQEPKLNQILHSALHGQDNLINFIHDYNQHYDKEPSLDYIQQLFSAFTRATILSMTNNGSLGVDNLNQQLEARLKQMLHCHSDWYNGRSILIRENEQGLHNGDIGICLLINNKPRIYFADGRSFIPECLPKYSLAYAITIHKSQGSEYNLVRIVIADHSNQTLLSKELIYTAITRAKTQVELFASLDPLLNLRPTKRTSGLTELMSTTN